MLVSLRGVKILIAKGEEKKTPFALFEKYPFSNEGVFF